MASGGCAPSPSRFNGKTREATRRRNPPCSPPRFISLHQAARAAAHGQSAGFNLKLGNCSIPRLAITNFGYVDVEDGYLGSVVLTNDGIPMMGGMTFKNLLSENLNNQNWMTTGGGLSEIQLEQIRVADSVGTYLIKNTSSQPLYVSVRSTYFGGRSYIDPSSYPESIGLIAEGFGAKATYVQAVRTLEWAQLSNARGPAIFYAGPHFTKYLKIPALQLFP